MRRLWRQSIRKVNYHSRTLLHRSQVLARLWFMKLPFKKTRETINVLTIAGIHYFFQWTSFRSSRSGVVCKKGVFTFHRISSKKPMSVVCNFIKKETLLHVFECCETFGDTIFKRTPPVVVSFLLSRFFLHFWLKWRNSKNFTKLSLSQTSFYNLQNLTEKQSPGCVL